MKRTLSEINTEYENVLHSSLNDYQKSVKFADLMTELEGSYKVPMLKSQEWENQNKPVIALYRKISRSRSFED